MKKMMLGNEAIARGAYEAGVQVSSAYPGTPSTEISEAIVAYKDELYCEWAPNEKVALEVAIGASVSGVRSMASMKHVGLNVAADPLYTVAYTGVTGGLVIAVADDPGMYSSQNEQDTRQVCRAANVPVLEPSDSVDAKNYMKFAYDISEQYDTPVVVRSTTRLAHSQCEVELEERVNVETVPYEKNIGKYVVIPSNSRKRHPLVVERMKQLAKDSCEFKINKVNYDDTSIGFITSGIPYFYVKEAMPKASVLKLGMVHPLPKDLILEFASKVDKLVIFEELEPVIEEQVRAWGIDVVGKETFSLIGEYSASMIREKILGQTADVKKAELVPPRPPILCPGCPHRSVYSVLKKLKIHAAGDIGCYTLGAVAPLSVVDTCFCMGGSISTLHGMEKARGKEYIKDWVAVIGDSTFMHTGVNSLMNMAYNKSSGTVLILDNSITAMTGHQDNPATGKTLMEEETPVMDIIRLCNGIGIEHAYEVSSFDLAKLTEMLKRETKRDAVSVIVCKAPCVLIKGLSFPKKCIPVSDKCVKCGACLVPGCPALTKNIDGSISIDQNLCNGCGLCMQLCKFNAIEEVDA